MNKKLVFIISTCLFLPLTVCGQSAQLADSLLQQGKKFDGQGRMKQAEFYYGEAYNIYRKFEATALELEAGKEYASAMVYQSKYDRAMELYKKLLAIEHPANDTYNRGDLYNSMGWASKRQGKLDLAMKFYQQALPLAIESGDTLLIGVVYNNTAGIYRSRGNYPQALTFYQKAFSYFKGIDNQRNIAITLSTLGIVYHALAFYDKALTYYNRSLKIRKQIGDVSMLSTIYDNIASSQRLLGNYDQALVAFQKSLDYGRMAGNLQSTATTLNNIGLLFKQLGEYDRAEEYYRQSLALSGDAGAPQSIAATTNNMGQLLWEQGRTDEAAEYFVRAYKIRKKSDNPQRLAYSLTSMIKLALHNNDYEEARSYAGQLKTIGDTTGSYATLEDASSYFGDISKAEGHQRQALQHYKKAYAYSEYLPPKNQIEPLKRLAEQYNTVGSDSAIAYGQKAVTLVEQSRSNIGASSELATGYFKKHSGFYTRMASWMLRYRKDAPGVFRMIEQAKARTLTEELARASQNIDRQLPEQVRIEQQEKRSRIDSLYTQLERVSDSMQRNQIKEKIRTAELDYTAYQNRLSEQYPVLERYQVPKAISLERAQTLVDENTAVLEYAVADNELLAFFIARDEVYVERVSLPGDQPLKEELTKWVAGFRDAIISNASQSQLKNGSSRLYNILIKPFEKRMNRYQNLIIVPDGALAYLPFEALSQGDRYLIENFRIKYEPSLTSLTLLEDPENPGRKDLLAVAASEFSSGSGRPVTGSRLATLPSTGVEVDSIAAYFKNVSILKDREVSEEAFKKLLQQNNYRYVHLATHGIIDESKPGRSGLAMSSGSGLTATSREDGLLRSSEVFGLNVSSDMVVLSACNTGLGEVVEGEGILGLQRSFFSAGTSTVVVSLWNVYDRSTAAFMSEFYKSLMDESLEESWTGSFLRWIGWDESLPFGQKAKAMRQAKLKMLSHPLFNHPVYWAPFIVVGR